MLGRGRQEPVVEPVPWDRPGRFTVTDVVRPATLGRKAVKGPRALRVATVRDGVRYFAPTVLVSRGGEEVPSYGLYDAVHPQVPLCSLTPEKEGARYRVTDGHGQQIGLVHRTPAAKRTIQHGWWLQQPGRPDIVARYHWARGSAKEIAQRGKETVVKGAGALAGSVVDSLISFGAEGDSGRTYTAKPVTWRPDGEPETVVLTCDHVDGVRAYLPQAEWFDRRLAFALAVLREA
ncbi:hypothetical protein ACYF6T_34340 [Streptomyces sp. 7R007]